MTPDPDFHLFETLLWDGQKPLRADRHLSDKSANGRKRLRHSDSPRHEVTRRDDLDSARGLDRPAEIDADRGDARQ